MKRNKKIITIMLIINFILALGCSSYAHSGRTDSRGGHKDKNNVSGLGSYHYHCGGHEAHLHPNGECPYSTSTSSSTSTTSSSNKKTTSSTSSSGSSKSSNEKTTSTSEAEKPVEEILKNVKKIEINEDVEIMEIGESVTLTTRIEPEDGYDNEVIWISSDREIANIDATGKVVAKKAGVVEIKATNINGVEDSIKIVVIEKEIEENTVEVGSIEDNNINSNTNSNEVTSNEITDTASGILTMGMIAGGYYLYKKKKG